MEQPGKEQLGTTATLDGAGLERYCPSCDTACADDSRHCSACGARLVSFPPARDPLLGRIIDGRFTIEEFVGRGGMGSVYRARQHSVGREVAIKVMAPRLGTDRVASRRFLREAKLASRLSHPNILTVHDFGQCEDGILYLVMEFLRGETLRDLLDREGALSLPRLVDMAVQICDGLEAAHHLQIVHRDLKPSNIFLLVDPPQPVRIKVVDFGLAKIALGEDSYVTVTGGALVGTPAYMAPEVLAGGEADARSDLYSLGVMLYEMVTASLPIGESTARRLLLTRVPQERRTLPASVPVPLAAVIDRLLENEPAARFQSAVEVRDELYTLLDGGTESSLRSRLDSSANWSRSRLGRSSAGADRTPSPARLPAGGLDGARRSGAREPGAREPGVPEADARQARRLPGLATAAVAALLLAGVAALVQQRARSAGSERRAEDRQVRAGELPGGAAGSRGAARPAVAAARAPAGRQPEVPAGVRDVGLAPAAAPRVILRFASTPEGARVLDGRKLVCVTPCSADYERALVAREFSFEHPRRRPVYKLVDLSRDQEVKISLPVRAPRRRETPADEDFLAPWQ